MFPSDSNLEAEFTFETASQPVPEDPPFKMIFLGDWSGRGSQFSGEGASPPRPVFIDRDNFEDVLRKLDVKINLDLYNDGENLLTLHFKELEDFHPDRLFQQVPLFSDLRDLRSRLLNPETFERAAGEVRSWFGQDRSETSSESEPTAVESETTVVESENLLDQILGQTGGEGASTKTVQTTQSRELSKFIGKIVESHIIQTDENEQTKLLAIVDRATSDLMRTILHNEEFQTLESAWRAIFLLVRQIETDVDLKLYLFDISKGELADDLKKVNSLEDSTIYKWLVKETIETPGGEPYAVFCGNFSFGVNVDDIALLVRLAKIANSANAPFLSYILPQMLGINSLADNPDSRTWGMSDDSDETKLWSTLRTLPEANYLGLATPRFLARLPYGSETDPTEAFSFEEFTSQSEHDEYLWSNPSFACALLLAQSYRAGGWEMGNNLFQVLNNLPTHFFEDEGETKTKPCAEVLMTETACQRLLDEGIMPLISFRNTDRVQIGRFQSIAQPPKRLGGRWN